jgi:hypothetical protein
MRQKYLIKIYKIITSIFCFFFGLISWLLQVIFCIFTFNLYKDVNYKTFLKNRMLHKWKKAGLTKFIKEFSSKTPYTEPYVDGNINKFIKVSCIFLSIKLLEKWKKFKGVIYNILLYLWN